MNEKKKKAFTLTELLVVVLIIGVLSAVALPKFNRVIETRRTGEAEELLTSIRSEQEKRCSLDKKYASDFAQLGDIVANSSTENFTYSLTSKGVNASSKGKAYSVQMPSYRDGRLCCDGAYCESLNKNYPLCSSLTGVKEDASCEPSACEVNPSSCSCDTYAASHCECTGTCDLCAGKTCSGSSSQSCPAGTTGTQTRTCNCGVWGDWTGTCTPVETCSGDACCTDSKPANSQPCGCGGTQTRNVTCDTSGKVWSPGGWGACTGEPTRPQSKRDCNSCGLQSRSVSCNVDESGWMTGSWSTCKGAYTMKVHCPCGPLHQVSCKTGGSWNLIPDCAYVPGCEETYWTEKELVSWE